MSFGDYTKRLFRKNNLADRVAEQSGKLDDVARKRIKLRSLDDLTPDASDVTFIARAASATSNEPTDVGFTGVFMSGNGYTFNGTVYHWGIVKAGVLQVGGNDVAEFLAGAGAVVLNAYGVSLTIPATYTDESSIKFTKNNATQSYISGYDGGTNTLDIVADSVAGENSTVNLKAVAPAGQQALSRLVVNYDGRSAIVSLIKNSTTEKFLISTDTETSGSLTVNINSFDKDTIIKGTGGIIATFDAGLDAVGFGGAAESGYIAKFTGNTKVTGNGEVGGTLGVTGVQTNEVGAVINNSAADSDTQIKGDTDANLIRVDASTDRVGIGTATPASKLDVAGLVTVSGGIDNTNGHVRSFTAAMADDNATSFLPTKSAGMILFSTQNSTNWGMIFYNAAAPSTVAINVGSNTNVTTGALAGTTGTDGKFTVSAHATDGKLYFENRSGGSRTIYVTLF